MTGTSRGRGRPLTDDDIISVAIPERGLRALWSRMEGRFLGDDEITLWANTYAATGHLYDADPAREPIVCGTDTDDAILASLLAACGGRGVVLSGGFSDAETELPDEPSLTAEEKAALKESAAE